MSDVSFIAEAAQSASLAASDLITIIYSLESIYKCEVVLLVFLAFGFGVLLFQSFGKGGS